MKIGFFIFDGMTQLDFTGPLQVLGRMPNSEIFIIAKAIGPVSTDGALTVLPSHDMATAPDLDLLCIPGGFGIVGVANEAPSMAFIKRQGEQASYVTSVCTGALLLGAAGLLNGRKATTHWAYHSLLARFGAEPVSERVVRDGNVFTGGGVTAGIDFALTIMGDIHGPELAKAVQLGLEYNPQPPFQSGHPDQADVDILAKTEARYAAPIADTLLAFAPFFEDRKDTP